jgi:hypothetical protein
MNAILAFAASFVLLFSTVLIFAGVLLGLVFAAGHLLEVWLGRKLDANRPTTRDRDR